MTSSSKNDPKHIQHVETVYNETASDIFYMEVTVKSYANYVTDATNSFPSVNLQDTMSKELTV